jgi:hypothetical protein
MKVHRKHRGHGKYQGNPQKASKKDYCLNSECDMPKGFRLPETNLCCRYRPCEKQQLSTINQKVIGAKK